MFYETLLEKRAEIDPYMAGYAVGATALGVGGALGGAALQRKGTLQGLHSDKLSPKERKARIRRQRLTGALGGAARGLGFNHMLFNAAFPTGSSKRDALNIAGGAGLAALGGGYADHKRLDIDTLKATHPRKPGEKSHAYTTRIKLLKANKLSRAAVLPIGLARVGLEVNADARKAFVDAGLADYWAGGVRQKFRSDVGSSWRGEDVDVTSAAEAAAALLRSHGFELDTSGTPGDVGKRLKSLKREIGRKHHPDMGGDTETAQELNAAILAIQGSLEKTGGYRPFYGALFR